MYRVYIPLVSRGETCKIFLESIILIEQELRKARIYTDEENYSLYSKIEEFTQYLDGRFLRCHQSYIINLDKVVKMKAQTIFFENGLKIMIGREKFINAKQNFTNYITLGAKKNIAGNLGI